MLRVARIDNPDLVQHVNVIIWGIEQGKISLDDQDRQRVLGEASLHYTIEN